MGTLGTDLLAGADVALEPSTRLMGTYVIGKTGTGKTTLLESMVLQDIAAGSGVAVVDPHGDLIDELLVRIPRRRARDVALFDAGDVEYPFGLNILECSDPSNAELVARKQVQGVEVFEMLWGGEGTQGTSWGPRLEQFLRAAMLTLLQNPGSTLIDMPRLFTDDGFRQAALANVSNERVREFWREFDELPPRARSERAESTENKLDSLIALPIIANIVGQRRTTVDFRQIMDEGRIALFRLPVGRLGETVVSLLGSLIVLELLNAALSREDLRPTERRPFYLYADEFQRFATPAFTTLLTEARKYGVATVLANQVLAQLPATTREAVANAASLVAFAVTGEDGRDLARQFDRTPPSPQVAGRQTTLTICQDPVAQLVRSGHQDQEVRRLAIHMLAPLTANVATAPDAPFWQCFPEETWRQIFLDEGGYFAGNGTLRLGEQLINALMVDMMEHRVSNAEMPQRLFPILFELRAYFGIAAREQPLYIGHSKMFQRSQTNSLLEVNWVAELCGEPELKALIQSMVGGDFRSREQVTAYGYARSIYWHAFLMDSWKDRPDVVKHFSVLRASYEASQARKTIAELLFLGATLAADPILVDSGQWSPAFERPRTYADVEGEIASRLVNQPRFHATCRIMRDGHPYECQIVTSPLLAQDEAHSFTGPDALRALSRHRYSRPRAVVEAEMKATRGATGPAASTTRTVRLRD